MRHKIKIQRRSWLDKEQQNLSERDRICRDIIEYGILSLIVFSPLVAASVNEWSILVIQLTVLVMLGAYLFMKEKPQRNVSLSRSIKWAKYLFVAFFVYVVFQIIPLPAFVIKILSPNTYSFQSLFTTDFQSVKFLSLSLIPAHTLRQGLELLAYFLLGFIIVNTVTEKRQISRIISVLIAVGIFEALYGMFELYNKNPRILFYKKIYGLDSASGTFVNRNHFSGYLEMVIPLAIGLIIARIDLFSMSGLKWREKIVLLSEKNLSTNLLISFGVVIMALGIMFSKSRSGVFLLVFIFFLIAGLSMLYSGKSMQQRKWIRRILVAMFLAVIFISLQIGINATLERFAIDRLLQENRPAYWAETLDIFSEYPIFGIGLGTFPSIYPDWEESGGAKRLYHAHNDFLEYLAELGVLGFILLLGGLLYMLVVSFLTWRRRTYSWVKGLSLGGIVALLCMLIHSITDFNLHIPANMLLFAVVLSLTFVMVFYRKREEDVDKREHT